jgi:hypothetical protein
MHNKLVAICLAGLLVCGGCGRKEMFAVSGKVTFDGEPVSNGEIQFLPPIGEKGAPVAGRVENGQYHLLSKAGPKRVSIRAARVMGTAVPNAMGAAFVDYIPAKFNSESTLTAEVQPSDDNQFNFDLQSDAAR